MSTARSHPDPADLGLAGLRMTAREFLALGQTRERYELIDGVVCMSPRPTTHHQTALRLVQKQLEAYIDANPGSLYFPDTDLELGPSLVYAPDLACYRPARLPAIPAKLTLPPDLIIEILSPGTKAFDLTTKRDDYEKFGVGEYWALDPAGKDTRLRAYRRRKGLLVEEPTTGDSIRSESLPGFALDLRPLRALDPYA